MNEFIEFYIFELDLLDDFNLEKKKKRDIFMLLKDIIFVEFFQIYKEYIVGYYEYDFFLDYKEEEELIEEERKVVWVEYEVEKKGLIMCFNILIGINLFFVSFNF